MHNERMKKGGKTNLKYSSTQNSRLNQKPKQQQKGALIEVGEFNFKTKHSQGRKN